MKRLVAASVILTLAVVMMPLFFAPSVAGEQTPVQTLESAQPSGQAQAAPTGTPDAEQTITVSDYGETKQTTMAEYLPYAVAAEMPVTFEAETLKAQAVAARTYILYCTKHKKEKHPDADICTDSGCCLAYCDETKLRANWGAQFNDNMAKIRDAVKATDGQALYSNGDAILAAFHSSSAGKTESGGELWNDVPYLSSVTSPETENDVPNYTSTVIVTPADFKETIARISAQADLSDNAAGWLGKIQNDDSGRVHSVIIGGETITGSQLRSAFSLRSTAFTLEYDSVNFVFTVTGYGHGLGMSQYGANVMAKKGFTYSEILEHYYSGAVLS